MQMGPIHPDAEETLNILLDRAPMEPEVEGEMQDGLQALIDAVENDLQDHSDEEG